MVKICHKNFKNRSEIVITGVQCNYTNIINVIRLIPFDNAVIVLDTVTNNGEFFRLIKEQELYYCIYQQSAGTLDLSVWTPSILLSKVIKTALQENPESLLIYRPLHAINKRNVYSYDRFNDPLEFTDIFIFIAADENVISIYGRNNSFFPKELSRAIQALQFEKPPSFRKGLKQFIQSLNEIQ